MLPNSNVTIESKEQYGYAAVIMALFLTLCNSVPSGIIAVFVVKFDAFRDHREVSNVDTLSIMFGTKMFINQC